MMIVKFNFYAENLSNSSLLSIITTFKLRIVENNSKWLSNESFTVSGSKNIFPFAQFDSYKLQAAFALNSEERNFTWNSWKQ